MVIFSAEAVLLANKYLWSFALDSENAYYDQTSYCTLEDGLWSQAEEVADLFYRISVLVCLFFQMSRGIG